MRTFDELTQAMRGFQEARVLLTAVELDVFTAAGEGAKAAEIAARIKGEPRATEMLLNALVALGALERNEGLYRCSRESVRFQAARAGMMHTVNLWDTWSTLTGCVRAGTAVRKPGVDAQEAEWTEAFIAAMHANAMQQAYQMVEAVGAEGLKRVLDVGGGSGAYAIAFAQANPELLAEVLDLAPVCRIAERHIRESGLSSRVRTRTGDLTKDE
nr:acetylserotonin O-methyltransferase [Bryobacter sp.]